MAFTFSDTDIGYKWRNKKDGKLTSEQETAIKKAQEYFKEAYTCRENHKDRMIKNEKLYNNQTPKNTLSTSDVKYALALATVETMIPPINDNYPEFYYAPKRINDYGWQDMLNERSRHLLEAASFKSKGVNQAKESLIYREGVMRMVPILKRKKEFPKNFNELSETEKMNYQTLGGLEISNQDPFTLFPDPAGTDIILGKTCRYFCIAEPISINAVADLYDMDPSEVRKSDFDWRDFKMNTDDTTQNIQDISKDEFTLIVKCYWMSPGDKYQYGRKTIFIDNQLLEDEALSDEWTPYFLQKNYSQLGRLHGISEPEIAAASIFTVNSFTSHITDNLASYGKPKEMMTERLIAKLQSDTYDPGVIPVEDTQRDYKTVSFDPVPSSLFNYLSSTLDLHQQVTGMHDSLLGERPAGITSAMGIEALRETALVRVRHKIKQDIMPMLERIGKYVEHLIKTYDAEVFEIRKQNDNGEYKFLSYDPTAKYDIAKKKFFRELRGSGIKPSDYVALEDTQFDIIIELGRGFDEGSVAKELRGLELYEKGIYPFPMMVNDLRLSPDRKKAVIDWWNQKNFVISTMGRLKEISDAMANIKNSQDWVNSPELKELQQIMKQLAKMSDKELLQNRV